MSLETFIARQPIFDADLKVRGYELLHRSGWTDVFDERDADRATVELLNGSLLVNRLEDLTDGRPGYINVPRNLLLLDFLELLPPHLTVIEVLEDVQPEPKVVAALRRLRAHGYTIALDDFVDSEQAERLVALSDIVKVDFVETTPAQRVEMLARHRRPDLVFLAEKVETREEFDEARRLGFTLFQGFFFCKPQTQGRKDLPRNKINYVRFLKEVTREELALDVIEEIIKAEISLSAKLLRYLNSAYFGLQDEITSIHQALIHMGERPLRRWGTLLALFGLGEDKPLELVRTCLVRARFCETLARGTEVDAEALDLYLTGMFSAIDALMDQPLDQALAEIGLKQQVQEAIRGDDSVLGRAFGLAVACERGDWRLYENVAAQFDLDPSRVASLYAEALFWADGLFEAGAAAA